MIKLIRQFVEICAEILPISEPIYEFGSFQGSQGSFLDLRPFFPDKEYIGADMQDGLGVDIVLNLHDIDLPSDHVGTVLCLNTFEHVEFPRKAIEEIYRILKSNGILIISSHMNFPIHGAPNDYWRFTPDGFRSLLKTFDLSFVEFYGDHINPPFVIGIGFKGSISENIKNKLIIKIKHWKVYGGRLSKRWKKLLLKLIPPAFLTMFLNIYKRIRGAYCEYCGIKLKKTDKSCIECGRPQ
ncbi:hypothetical protein LCGC14_1038590 [marine sediment metagenome]|uniref:Methyltransferase type 11 domain-containing protein n=1 Tax=marine sediment metagenome TaxID=412755 RepID=A0A0F9MSG5_9ZZZZ